MKYLIIATLAFGGYANASVKAFLKADPVIFVIQDDENNDDATKLFYYLDVDETGTTVKEKNFLSVNKKVSFSCRYSEMIKKSSCTVKVARDENLDFRFNGYVVYELMKNDDALDIYWHLVTDSDGKFPMYYTEKQELAFTSTSNRFVLTYKEIE